MHTNSFTCNDTNNTDNINNVTILITNTADVSHVTITSSSWIPIITSTGNGTPITNNNNSDIDHLNNKSVISYPVIVSSLAGGLLGLCFIGCVMGLLLRRKLHKKHASTINILSPINLLFDR